VVTDVGDSARIVGDTGIVIPPRDSTALANACLELIRTGPEESERRGASARQRVVTHFSMPRMVSTYQQLYAEIGAA
jgi:glycosyltransferase involved in cell wall biosynthesis